MLDPRIGLLNSGKYYCFPEGNGKPEFIGTLEEVEFALGLRNKPPEHQQSTSPPDARRRWHVKLTFQCPAWDEVGGIDFFGIEARSKSEANSFGVFGFSG